MPELLTVTVESANVNISVVPPAADVKVPLTVTAPSAEFVPLVLLTVRF